MVHSLIGLARHNRALVSIVSLILLVAVLSLAANVRAMLSISTTQRITPVSFTVSSDAGLPAEAKATEAVTARLAFDRDTTTEHAVFALGSVTATLEAVTELKTLAIYGDAPYRLTVDAWIGGGWTTLTGLKNESLANNTPNQWTRYDIGAVSTNQLRFQLSPLSGGAAGTATGLKEIALWGGQQAPANYAESEQVTAQAPASGLLRFNATEAEGLVSPTNGRRFTVSINQQPSRFTRAWLVYETYGYEHWMAPVRAINGTTALGGEVRLTARKWNTLAEPIHPDVLVNGSNSIDFGLSVNARGAYTVKNVRLVVEPDTGLNLIKNATVGSQPAAVIDHNTQTGWTLTAAGAAGLSGKPTLELTLARSAELDAVWLNVNREVDGAFSLEYQDGDKWKAASIPTLNGKKLSPGWNRWDTAGLPSTQALRLVLENGSGNATVQEVAVQGLQTGPRHNNAIHVTFPDAGQYYGRTAFIRGVLGQPNHVDGEVQLFAGGKPVPQTFGGFEVSVTKDEVGLGSQKDNEPWQVTLEALYPDGTKVEHIVVLNNGNPQAQASGVLPTAAALGAHGNGRHLKLDGAELIVDPDATDDADKIKIKGLRHEELPPLDPGMTNVTRGPHAGFRFTPHGMKFRKKIQVTLPFDKIKLPKGLTEHDIQTFYYDEEVGHWVVLEKHKLNSGTQELTSLTDHFTDMINATLTVPDHPQAVNFNPTQIKDIKAADPGAEVNLIEPPQANNMGDARLSYPLQLPAGRAGLQPQLAIQYNSSGGNGWLGLGWDLSVPSITIDTRWGAPRYREDLETETYMLNGQQLSPVAHRGAIQNRVADRDDFHTRVEGAFQKIIRHGTKPSKYWWEVIDKNGTRNLYGGINATDTNGKLGSNKGIYKWMLRRTIDPNGNTITYNYDLDSDPGIVGSGVPGKQLYISSIKYTGHNNNEGVYSVHFVRDAQLGESRRPDVTIDARGGFKQVTASRLRKVEIKFQNEVVRSYELKYKKGAFEKSLLTTVAQFGAEGTKFNEHAFDYYDDITDENGNYKGFVRIDSVNTGSSDVHEESLPGKTIPYTVLGGSRGKSVGFEGYGGVGLPVGTKTLNIGLGSSSSQSKSKGNSGFFDVDGDGLPDKVFKSGYRKNTTASGALGSINFDSGSLRGVSNFGKTAESESTTHNLGLQVYLFGLSVNGGLGMTTTNEKSYISDVNGDGLADLVNRGRVLFNAPRINETGEVEARFSANSFETSTPIGNVGGSVSEEVIPDMSALKARMEAENPLMDNVRRWVAPYNGTVKVSSNVKLVNFLTDPRTEPVDDNDTRRIDREEYDYADGVRVAIQHNDTELWSARIEADNYDAHPANIASINVRKGDELFFRVGSVFDGNYDLVDWSPVVEYTGEDKPGKLDVNNLPEFNYRTDRDFIYSNREMELTVPYKGTIKLVGKLNKSKVTTDDVTVEVTLIKRELNPDNTLKSESSEVVVSKTIPWDSTDPLVLNEDIEVEQYNGIKLHFVTGSPIDHTVFSWGDPVPGTTTKTNMPRLYYTAAFQESVTPLVPVADTEIPPAEEQPTNGDTLMNQAKNPPAMQPVKDEDGNDVVIPGKWFSNEELYNPDTGEPLLVMPAKYDADIYPANHLTRPQEPWVAPRSGVIFLTPWLEIKKYQEEGDDGTTTTYTKVRDGSVFFTIKRRDELIARHEVIIKNGKISNEQGYHALKVFKVNQGDEIYYDASFKRRAFTAAENELSRQGKINQSLEQEIESSIVKIHYASDTAWTVPLTDNIDFLSTLSGHADDEDNTVDKRYMLVIRRGETDVVHSEIISGTSQESFVHKQNVVEGEKWYFDIFTADPNMDVPGRNIRSRYQSDVSWTVPFTGKVKIEPVLNFKPGAVPDSDITLQVLQQGSEIGRHTYRVESGEVKNTTAAPFTLDILKDKKLEFVFHTPHHAMSSFLADKGAVRVGYIDKTDWQVPEGAGSIEVTPEPRLTGSGAEDGSITFRVLRGNTELASRSYTVNNGVITSSDSGALDLSVNDGQNLNFIFETNKLSIAQAMQASKVNVAVSGSNTNAPYTINLVDQLTGSRFFYIGMPYLYEHQDPINAVRHFPLEDPLWGDPYRGWGTAAYNGNGERAEQAINRFIFKMKETEAAYKNRDTEHIAWIAYPEVDKDRWGSMDNHWWTGAVEMSASRKGTDFIFIPKAEDYAVSNSGDFALLAQDRFTDPVFDPSYFSGAARPAKMSESDTTNFGFGFYLSRSSSSSDTKNQLDVMDMNGDRMADVVGENGTQYTWADGTLFDYVGGIGRARESEEENETLGLGVGGPSVKADADGAVPEGGDTKPIEIVSFPISGGISEGENENKVDLTDVNGDGLPDRVVPGGGGLLVALNTGYGFLPAEPWNGGSLHQGESDSTSVGGGFSMWNGTISGGTNINESHNFGNAGMMDINGDGLADAVVAGSGGNLVVRQNTGSGFTAPFVWRGSLQAYREVLNGPGSSKRSLTPLSDGSSGTASGSLKFGFGFDILFFNISFSFGGTRAETVSMPSVSYQDINGDGFVDGIRTANTRQMDVALNPIQRTNMLRSVARPMGGTIDIAYKRIGNTFKYPQSKYVMSEVKVFDGVEDKVNGEGSDFQLSRYDYADGFYSRYERDFYGFKTVVQKQYDTTNKAWSDLDGLDSDDIFRRTTQIYFNESFYFKGMLDTELMEGRKGSSLVKYTRTDNDYQLKLVKQHYADKPGSRFPALESTTREFFEGGSSPVTNVTKHYYDDYGNVTTFIDEGDTSTSDDDVTAVMTYTNCTDSHIVGKATSIVVSGNDGTWRKRTGSYDCTTGNLTDQYAWLEDGGDAAHTKLTYNGYGNLHTVTGPANEDGERLELSFEYDDVAHTHVKHIRNVSFNIDSYAHTDLKWGKPEWTEDVNGNRITYSYDEFGRTRTIVGPYESADKPTISFAYKTIAPLQSREPGAAPKAIKPHWAKTFHFDRDWKGDAKTASSGTIDTVLFTDGIKRVLQTKKDATINGIDRMIVSGRVLFDGLGRTVAQYYPVDEEKAQSPTGNTGFTTTVDTGANPTTMVYDALDRNVSTTIPDGTTTRMAYDIATGPDGYNRLRTRVTDAEGNSKETFRDVRELITAVKEFNPGAPGQDVLTTTYNYDSLKQITTVTDAKANVTRVVYDNLGRRTHINNPDTGDVETVYDLAGNVIRKITPNLRAANQFIDYDYDRTRLVAINYPQNAENNVTYEYGDTSHKQLNQAGRIISVTHGGGSETREYGKLGETTVTRTTIKIRPPDKTYTTRFTYDTFGRLLVLNFPDGEELRHDYDSGGNITRIEGQKRSGAPHVYLDTLHYDKFEQRTYMKVGNGVETNYSYQPDNRRLEKLASHQPNKGRANGRLFQNIHYGYDQVGNITTLANQIDIPANKDMGGPTQQSFTYDKLYRLVTAEGRYTTARSVNAYTLNMQYDGIHNITNKQQTNTLTRNNGDPRELRGTTYDFGYNYNASGAHSRQPHAPIKIGSRDFTYDLNGNQTGFSSTETSERRVITWDEENRIRSIADKGRTSTYTYDDQGQRVTKKNDQGEVAYISQFYVVKNGAIPSKHIYAGTSRILTKRLGGGNPTWSPGPDFPRGNPHDPSNTNGNGGNGGGNGQGSTNNPDKTNNGKGPNKQTTASVNTTGHPGQGIYHRSDRANEVAQNTIKNKHLNGTGVPGNSGHTSNGQGPGNGNGGTNNGNGGNAGGNGNGGNSGNTGGNGGGVGIGGGGQGGNSAWKPEEEFMYYYHPDHLGSTGYVTDEDGLLYEHIEYFPFGETWVQESTVTDRTPYLYTSKEFDEVTKLYYYGARYYDPRTSVWQSADPILGDYLPTGDKKKDKNLPGMGGIYNSRNLGMYGYAVVNPMTYKDPDGNLVLRIPFTKYYFIFQRKSSGGFRAYFTTKKKGRHIDPTAGGWSLFSSTRITFKNDDPKGKSTDQRVSFDLADMIEETVQSTKTKKLNINSTTGGKHSKNSNHYKRKALDYDSVNGIPVGDRRGRETVKKFQQALDRHPNIRENFGPAFKHKTFINGKRNNNWPVGGHRRHGHASSQN